MNKIVYWLFCITSYPYFRLKYPASRGLKFNGYFIQIFGKGRLECGVGSYISFFTRIFIDEATTLSLGNNVSISHNVRIYTSKVDSIKLIRTGLKETKKGDVCIGNNVLIGANVYIGPGISICDNVVVGANSVIHKSITESGVYSGNPVRKIADI